ncbi:MAG: hypothetical protein AAF391_13590, partial [Bacteroidota bacterium]
PLRSFNVELIARFNDLHLSVHGDHLTEQPIPSKYTGEIIGMEYLFKQINLEVTEDYIDAHIEKGLDVDDGSDSGIEDEEPFDLPEIDDDDKNEEDEEAECLEESSTDSKGIPGWHKVAKLAKALLGINGISLTNTEVKNIRLV